MKKAVIFILLAAMLITSFISCSDTPSASDDTSGAAEIESDTLPAESIAADESGLGPDGLYTTGLTEEELRQWAGTEFHVRTFETADASVRLDFEKITDDPVDLEIYYRALAIEEDMGIDLIETVHPDYYATGHTKIATLVESGDDTFYLIGARGVESYALWADGYLIPFNEMPYVQLERGYWAQDLNPCLTIAGEQYVAVGAADTAVYDLMFVLLFNKELFSQLGYESPYDLVESGEWTIDKMREVMKNSYFDENSNGKMDDSDSYGYLGSAKHLLFNFWIPAEVSTIKKDGDDYPASNFSDEKFHDLFVKLYEIMYDDECYFLETNNGVDVSQTNIKMFQQNQSLFMDCSFYFIPSMRNIEMDFGIIPYPKYDKDQDQYHSRVSYYYSLIIPSNCKDTGLAGAALEYLHCYSANKLIPKYYDVALRSKAARDEESQAMLDIIFYNRLCDLGDTTFCDLCRDGIFANLFINNNRNYSAIVMQEKSLNKKIEKVIENALSH